MREQIKQLIGNMATSLRSNLASQVGETFNKNRNVYHALGYKHKLTFADYKHMYDRQDIAGRIIDEPVLATWADPPIVTDDPTKETEFDKAWNVLCKSKSVFRNIIRADKMCTLGNFSIIVLGFNDIRNLNGMKTPVRQGKAKELLYMQPYQQSEVKIKALVTDTSSERYGLPEVYTITPKIDTEFIVESFQHQSFEVHFSRIIHLVWEPFDSAIVGTPYLKRVFNRLEDVLKVAGGSAEMFWRGARGGFNFNVDPEARFSADMKTKIQDQLDEYENNLRRTFWTEGVKIEEIPTQVESPLNHFEILLSLISAGTGIPKRILIGSEKGELSSSQDQLRWFKLITARMTLHGEPMILRPLIDTLIYAGVLPAPLKNQYEIIFPDLLILGKKEKAEVAKTTTSALKDYVQGDVSIIMPPKSYLAHVLQLSKAEVEQIQKDNTELVQDELDDFEAVKEEPNDISDATNTDDK